MIEYEQIQMKEENDAIQNRGKVLKEKENTFEEMLTTMQGKFEKIKRNYLTSFLWVGGLLCWWWLKATLVFCLGPNWTFVRVLGIGPR